LNTSCFKVFLPFFSLSEFLNIIAVAIYERAFVFTTSDVIPALDAEIQEFYQVGEYKSYVKIHSFMENWIPVSSTRMTRNGATWMTGSCARDR
jgi:hypothetical protein